MSKIFITYRRADTAGWAGRIGDHLTDEFGADSVFLDVDDIPVGVDFEQAIDAAAQSCAVMLTLIGRHWLAPDDDDGEPQIRAPDDHLRRELRLALRASRPIIPVLVDGAKMPGANDLPRDLAGLSAVNAFDLSTTKFRHDVADLAQIIRPYVEGSVVPPTEPTVGPPTAALPVVDDPQSPDPVLPVDETGLDETPPEDAPAEDAAPDDVLPDDAPHLDTSPDDAPHHDAPHHDAPHDDAAAPEGAPPEGDAPPDDAAAPADEGDEGDADHVGGPPTRRTTRRTRRPPGERPPTPPPDRWRLSDQSPWLLVGAGAAVLVVVIAVVSTVTGGNGGGNATTTTGGNGTTTSASTVTTVPDGPGPPTAMAAIDEIDVGGRPQHVLLRDGRAWVADSERGAVLVRDVAGGTTTEIPISDGAVVHLVEAGGLIWVNARTECAIVPIDPSSLAVGERIPAGDGCVAGDMAAAGSVVWVAHSGAPELLRVDIDGATSTAVAVDGLLVSVAAAHGSLWVTTEDGAVLRLDPGSGEETGRVDVGGQPLLMAGTDEHLWVSLFQDGQLAVIDPADVEVVDRVDVRPGPLTLAGDGSTMWAIHFTDEAFLTAVDGDTRSVAVEEPVPTQATGVSVEGDTVAVTSFGARALSLFEASRG